MFNLFLVASDILTFTVTHSFSTLPKMLQLRINYQECKVQWNDSLVKYNLGLTLKREKDLVHILMWNLIQMLKIPQFPTIYALHGIKYWQYSNL